MKRAPPIDAIVYTLLCCWEAVWVVALVVAVVWTVRYWIVH